MEYPNFFPETALALLYALVYGMAYILAGGVLIALTVYIVLVCSEMFFSELRSKAQRSIAPESDRHVPVAKESLDLSAAQSPILTEPERLEEKVVRATALVRSKQVPMTVPASLESELT